MKKKESKKIIMSTSLNKGEFTQIDQIPSFGDKEKYEQESPTDIQIKVAQIESNLIALKEKVESGHSLKLWIFGAVLAILGGAVAGFSIYLNIIKDSQDTYRNLQKDYYQELINLRNEFLNCRK